MLIPYVVQPGDSLYYIAKMFDSSEDAILAANGLTHPALIRVEQLLYIPVAQPLRQTPHPGSVAPGEGPQVTPVSTPVAAVPSLAPRSLSLSPDNNELPQAAAPPHRSAPPAATFRYTMQAGDTVSSLARRFGVSTEAILQANYPDNNSHHLSEGQTILLPLPPRAL